MGKKLENFWFSQSLALQISVVVGVCAVIALRDIDANNFSSLKRSGQADCVIRIVRLGDFCWSRNRPKGWSI